MTSDVILNAIKSKKAKQCKRLVSAKNRQHFSKPVKHDPASNLRELYTDSVSARQPSNRHRARSALTANRRNTFNPP